MGWCVAKNSTAHQPEFVSVNHHHARLIGCKYLVRPLLALWRLSFLEEQRPRHASWQKTQKKDTPIHF